LRLDFYKNTPQEISRKNKILLTAIITASTLAFNSALNETLYWLNGAHYFWCQSLFILALGLAVKALRDSKFTLLICVIVLFLNGIMHEQICIFQGILAFIAMIYFYYDRDKKRALICCILWLTSIAAFCVSYFSPGTVARMSSSYLNDIPIIKRFTNAAVVACSHGLFTIIKFFVKPLNYVFLLFLPLIAKKIPAAKIKLKIWQIVILTALIAPLMQFLEGYGLGIGFPDRAVSLTLYCMFVVWCLLFSFFYRGKITTSEKFSDFSRKFRYPFLIFALLISFNFIDAVIALKIAPAYKAEHSARVQSISEQKAAGVSEIIVKRFDIRPALIYDDFSCGKISGFAAKSYGVENFWNLPGELIGDTEAFNDIRNGNTKPLIKFAEKDMRILESIAVACDPMQNREQKNSMGLEVSYKEAERWNRLGASHGNPQSMRSLSRLIYTQDKSFHGILRALYWLMRSQLATLRL